MRWISKQNDGDEVNDQFSLNIFDSTIQYTEKDGMRLKVRHYPLAGSIDVYM